MTYLDYYRVGRTQLWQGAPLRTSLRVEPAEPGAEGLTSFSLEIRGREGERVGGATVETELHRAVFEYPTDEFAPGPHRLVFLIDSYESDTPPEEVTAPEELWILEPEDYQRLVYEELEEEFQRSAGLGGEEAASLIQGLLRDRFERWRLGREWGYGDYGWGLLFSTSLSAGEGVFPAAPLRWTTEKLLDLLQDLAVPGLAPESRLSVHLDPARQTVFFEVRARPALPISEAYARALADERFSEIALLRSIANGGELSYDVDLDTSVLDLDLALPMERFPTFR